MYLVGGIQSTNNVEIIVGDTGIPTIASDKLSICAVGNDKVTLTTSSCKDGLLKWSNSSTITTIAVSPIDNTTYTATCAIAGCKESAVSNSILIQAVRLSVTASNSGPYFEGELLRLNSGSNTGTAPLKYEWTGPNSFLSVVQNPSILNISISASGIYSVKVTDANNCQGNAQTEVKISLILGNDTPKGTEINLYPNPVSEQLNVTFDTEQNMQISITILDSRGRVIEQRKLTSIGGNQQEKFDIRNMTSGQYLLKINTSLQELVKKIVISQ